ncbi:Ribosomal L11 methyltransferase, PrmA [Nannochloropsis gaditana]|uniref:type I protein arginine methyltransferase n=1 Tax=Nannochloropsis gaditana TaxID=72520 RepID=W7TTE4_9STRA|nr:Ribosomal L11 methyltransferase, PrmA [Nannochloropsis gaditana]
MENLAPNGTSNGDNGGKYDSEIEDMTRKTGSIGSMKDDSTIMKGDAGAKAKDFAEYFCSYAYLYHQKQMLTDHRRMFAYHEAIMKNSSVFEGKTVVDVGTGTGVLAVWSAKAGAKRVVAVEYTDMAKMARVIVAQNGVDAIVEVQQGSAEEMEEVEPGSVDIIVSEWMGYFLLRESMLDSLVRVREKYLKKEGGHMFPSHATMYWALIEDERERQVKEQEYQQALEDWQTFSHQTKEFYDLDMAGLTAQYEEEQKEYYLLSSSWAELRAEQVVAEPVVIRRLDLKSCTFEEIKGVPETPFQFVIPPNDNNEPVYVSGFAGWFTTDFFGNAPGIEPLPHPTTLSTAPDVGYTHWGQQVFHVVVGLELFPGDVVEGTVTLVRQVENARLYHVEVAFQVRRGGVTSKLVRHKYQMP